MNIDLISNLYKRMKTIKENNFIDYLLFYDFTEKAVASSNNNALLEEFNKFNLVREEIKKVIVAKEISNINWSKYLEELKTINKLLKEEKVLAKDRNREEDYKKVHEKMLENVFVIVDNLNIESCYNRAMNYFFNRKGNYSTEINKFKALLDKYKIDYSSLDGTYTEDTAKYCHKSIVRLISKSRLELIKEKATNIKIEK